MKSQKAAGWRETAISPSNNPACLWFSGSNFCIVTVNYRSQMISKVGCPGKRLCKSIFHSLPTPRLFRTLRAKKNGTPPQPSWGWGRGVKWNQPGSPDGVSIPILLCILCVTLAQSPHLSEHCPYLLHRAAVKHPIKRDSGKYQMPKPTMCLSWARTFIPYNRSVEIYVIYYEMHSL